jgi:hypothetical protein
VPERVALVVQPMLGKLDRKTMKRAFVQPQYKTLYYLPGY